MNLRLLKFILFLPLFAACQVGSEILPPDSGENGNVSDFSCTLSAESLTFDKAYDYEPSSLSVSVGEETVVVDLSGAPWMEVEGDIMTISPNTEITLSFVPVEPNYSSSPREGVIVFKGKYTEESLAIPVSQAASFQDTEESLLNGWRLDSDLASSDSWKNGGVMVANKGDLKGLLTIEHSANSPVRIVPDDNRGTFTGMRPGDAVLLRTPIKSLAAGTDVSAMINLGHKSQGEKCRWVAEYWDENQWNEIRKFSTCYDAVDEKYNYNVATVICDFTLVEDIVNDYVKVRFRLLEGQESDVFFVASSPWTGAALEVNSAYPPVTDYKKVLILGNSFTYYWGSPFVLKQIARSQGHRLDVRVHSEPGATLAEHDSSYSLSDEAIDEGGYHYAILQDVSTAHAKFADGNLKYLEDAKRITDAVLAESRSCRFILENTWAYPGEDNDFGGYGSYDTFYEKLQAGCSHIAKSLRADISPVSLAFDKARTSHSDIVLLYNKDNHHPSRKGTYLKSCVNYLKIYGGEFGSAPYNGEVESADEAAVLRQIAIDAVNYVPEEKPKETLTLTMDFASWPFLPVTSATSTSTKSQTQDAYTFTQDGVEYPIEIYAPTDGYYFTGSALRFDETGGGYIKIPAIEDKALVELTVTITNGSGEKVIYVSSDGTDKGDIGNLRVSSGGTKTNSVQLTGTMLNTSYYLYTKSTKTQIGKIVLLYESY